ncbi:hypothetical protein KSF78_0001484 [Schistosoma japonicum]|nr:hypothetical protein KSF78_0001484 [Schistosoma japonicum]
MNSTRNKYNVLSIKNVRFITQKIFQLNDEMIFRLNERNDHLQQFLTEHLYEITRKTYIPLFVIRSDTYLIRCPVQANLYSKLTSQKV